MDSSSEKLRGCMFLQDRSNPIILFLAAPSGSPTSISFKFMDDTAVNITWAPPDEDKRNGKIIAYVICFPEKTVAGNCKNPISVPGSQTWYVLHDGDFSSQRVVEIRARTKEGTGPVGQATTGRLAARSSYEELIQIYFLHAQRTLDLVAPR